MDEEAQDEGHQYKLERDGDELTSKPTELEHQLEPEYHNDNDIDDDNDPSDTEEQTKQLNNDETSSSTDIASEQQLEHDVNDDQSSSIHEHGMDQMEADDDDEESPSREVDSELDKSESLPSLANSDQPSNQPEEINDRPYNHTAAQNGDKLIKPSTSAKKERHIADALPNDFDLLADYDDDSIESSQDATKLTWSVFRIAYLISAPAFIIGIALVIMGALNFPPAFNLLTIGIPVFIIAGLVFIGSTLYLCFYKAKKMRLFEFGGNDMEGEIAGVSNMSYAYDEETMVPNMAFNNNEEAMSSDQAGDVVPLTEDGEIVQTKVVYISEDQEESLPL